MVPLHPEIVDLPDWLAGGGLKTFQTIKSDPVGSVRHNFGRLLREYMSEPIKDPQKALYSLRSTFVNAMRRAGADIQVQRAILGHKEAGAIRHYDDGPEFEVKRKWVEATDPRLKLRTALATHLIVHRFCLHHLAKTSSVLRQNSCTVEAASCKSVGVFDRLGFPCAILFLVSTI